MPAAFVGLMMLTIDLNDQLQCHATEIDGVRRDWEFTTKLLISTTTIPQHLPHVLRTLIRGGSLMTSKLDRVMVTLQSSVHVAPVIRRCRLLAPSSNVVKDFGAARSEVFRSSGQRPSNLPSPGGVHVGFANVDDALGTEPHDREADPPRAWRQCCSQDSQNLALG